MSGKSLSVVGVSTMAVLAAAVSLYSLRYYGALGGAWFGIDPSLQAVIRAAPLQALTHMLIAPIALLCGPLQFVRGLRARHARLHRWSGRLYVATCLASGVGALTTAPHASGGPVAGLGFGILAILWIGCTIWGWRAAVRGDFARHRELMTYSYAMTFAAVTLRLQIPIGFVMGFQDYSAMSVWLAYTSWIPNVLAVALWTTAHRSKGAGELPRRTA